MKTTSKGQFSSKLKIKGLTRTTVDIPRDMNAALYLRGKREGQTKSAVIRSILARELREEMIEVREQDLKRPSRVTR